MKDDDLDKMADDIFNRLTGNSSKKDASEKGRSSRASRFEGLFDDIKKNGGTVPDNWQELVDRWDDEFDSIIAADLEEADLYEFEFSFMATLAATDWIDASSRKAVLGDMAQIMTIASEQGIVDIPSTGFKVTAKRREGLEIYFYEFPKPSRSPMALYGVIIYGSKGGRYYTLEFENPRCYMVCSPTPEDHFNFGYARNTTKEGFLKNAIFLYQEDMTNFP